MSYTSGIAPNMAALGYAPGRPHITCDGCGLRREVTNRGGLPAAWFMAGRSPPGWEMERSEMPSGVVLRQDWCPRCRPATGAK